MLLSTLGDSLLGNLLTGKDTFRRGESTFRTSEGTVRLRQNVYPSLVLEQIFKYKNIIKTNLN